jgi:hypothetical protein
MRRSRLILALLGMVAVLPAASCDSLRRPVEPMVSGRAVDNLALCGGGVRLERHVGLAAQVDAATAGGRLTLSDSQALEAAFLETFAERPADARFLFDSYLDCITGAERLEALVADLSREAAEQRRSFVAEGWPEGRIEEVMAFRSDEIAAYRRRDFIAGRDHKRDFVDAVVKAYVSEDRARGLTAILSPIAPPPPMAVPYASEVHAAAPSPVPPMGPRPSGGIAAAMSFCEAEYDARTCREVIRAAR